MRREGRQHGYVQTHIIMSGPCADASVDDGSNVMKNRAGIVPVAGVFARVSRRPTNHSKYTGKCRSQMCVFCRSAPATKARNKSKGRRKFGLVAEDEAAVGADDAVFMDEEYLYYEPSQSLLDDMAYEALSD